MLLLNLFYIPTPYAMAIIPVQDDPKTNLQSIEYA